MTPDWNVCVCLKTGCRKCPRHITPEDAGTASYPGVLQGVHIIHNAQMKCERQWIPEGNYASAAHNTQNHSCFVITEGILIS